LKKEGRAGKSEIKFFWGKQFFRAAFSKFGLIMSSNVKNMQNDFT